MAVHKLFPGDFVFNSNDSLDTQITASIDRGDFHLSVLSLLVLIVWSIYIMFYNSRILGLVVSLLARRFVRNGYIRFGSISLSALGGKLMLRDFAYMTNDYTVRCCYAIVVFNYWTQFVPGSKEGGLHTGNRCLYVYLYGFDLHMYNRTSVYDELQKLFKEPAHSHPTSIRRSAGDISSTKAVRESLTRKPIIPQASSVDSSDEDPHHSDTNLSSSSFMDLFWSHAHRLIPAIKFNLELTKICAGNHLLPRACMLSCTRLVGCYTREEPTYQSDKYQHKISANFVNLLCSLLPVSEYAGQHAIEEPPKSWDRTFHVCHFGRGMLTYIQDEPGLISNEPDQLYMSGGDITVLRTWPRWESTIVVTKDCYLHYGPWADRQREILWRFFFPSSYEPAQISMPPSHGQPRVARKFVVEVKATTNIEVNVVFVSHGRNQSMQLVALSGSSIKLSVPWLIEPDGMRTTFRASLVQGNLVAQHLWPDVLQTSQLDLDLYLFYPREWNTPHQWDINIKAKNPRLTILFDYKRFFKGLIEDWTRGSHPDLLCFVPCTYTFRVSAENLDFILLANDYNWVSAAGENAHIAFSGKRFNFSFDLPFVDFLPDVISLIYVIEGFSATLRLSLPETSTMLHVLREMHSRLRLVSRSGGSLSTNPFELHDESISANSPTGSSVRRHWIDCGRAQSLTLRIGYVYHPSPWTAEHWRFVPVEMRPEWPMAKSAAQPRWSRHRHHDRKAHLSGLYHPNSDSSSQSELEELALRGLRPEGSQTHGPTEAHLLERKFDVTYLAPDTVDVHLHIPNAQLCFYGALLRHFIHLKENYFGFCQKPVDFSKSPITGEEYLLSMMGLSSLPRGRTQETSVLLAASERVDLKRSKDQANVDPRDYRPLLVRLSLEFHNVQVHLPMHCSSSTAPCPTAFLDCIGFEMDKRWHETRIQLLFSPILLCVFDNPKPPRPKSSSGLSRGCIQLMGLCLRGQGMFSHAMLPLDAETLEYAWLLELTVGQLTGQLTAPQLTSVVRALNSFAFTMIDAENQLVCSHAFELCQHARPQALCPLRPTVFPKMLCPGESLLKYRFIRVSLDGLDVGIVETGSCLSIQLDPVRLTNCNMHGTARCNGLFILFPGVRLKQYIRSTTDEYRSFKNPVCYVNKILDSVVDSKSKRHQQSPWLAAGSLSLGPVHVNVAKVAERPEIPLWRLAFLKRHDLATKRLWFLWSNEATMNHASFRRAPKTRFMNSTYIAPNITQNCGCFGQCSFFGPNAYGHMLFDELSSGSFQQRAVFPPRSDYKPHLFSLNTTQRVNNQCAPFGFGLFSSTYSTSKDNTPDVAPPAAHFGESLLVEHRLLHELHNPSFCQERHNGLSLMRDETIVAYALSTASSEDSRICERCCDDCDLSDRANDSTSSSGTKRSLPGSPMDDAEPGYYGEASSSCDHYNPKRQPVLTKSASRPSSMSELLVPPDSQDEDDASSVVGSFSKGPNTPNVAFRRSFFSRLPSDLSLNSLIGPLTSSQPSSRSSLSSDNFHVTELSEVHITPVIPAKPTAPRRHIPPTPPPRQFTKNAADNVVAQKTVQSGPLEGATTSDVVIDTNLEKASEKFVDLRGQLNRPITDSGLLRSAYSHHLSVYRCASDWASTVKLNHRWHLCKFVYSISELHPTKYNACDTSADKADRVRFTWPYCRMGPALAPRFELIQPGFSPRHIVSKTDAQTTGCSSEKSTFVSVSDSVDHETRKRIAARSDVIVWLQNSVDLLLSPMFAESLERYLAVLTPVMINTSPSSVVNQLHIHCVNSQSRKIGHLIQTRPSDIHTYSNSTSNEDPCVSSDRLDTSTDLLHRHVFTGSHPLPPPPPLELPAKQSGQKVSAPQIIPVNVAPEASGTLTDYAYSPGEPLKLPAAPAVPATSEPIHDSQNNNGFPQVPRVSQRTSFDRRLSVPCRSLCESRTGRVIGSGKLTALSVERINVCFLQLYAVEDLVHLDSLRSGLHDLTCVSLLTFCVESVSFEMMLCNETHATLPNLEPPSLTPVESESSSDGSDPSRQPLLQQFPGELSHDFENLRRPDDRTLDTQFVSQVTPALAESKLGRLVSHSFLSETGNPASIPALSAVALPACRLSHSRQPSAPPALVNSSVPQEQPMTAVSLADCLHHDSASPCIANQKLTSHNFSFSQTAVINSKEETHCPLSTPALPNHCHNQSTNDVTTQGEVFDDQVMIDLANVLSCHGVPGSESVFQLNISRIHGQLRRLTRFSQFSPNVLLTAIPFESSRTFFAFEFDKDLQTNLTQPTSASRSVSSLNEQSAGWIMFECGLEKLSLSCDYRDGFGDTVSDGKPAVNYVKSSQTDNGGTSEEEHLNIHESISAKLRASKQPSFRKKKMSLSTAFTVLENAARSSSYSEQPESKHRIHTALRNVVAPGKKQANLSRNGVLSQLRVSTVWLNFPTPKRLPNKRRVELVRSDWNLLSTAAPSIKAWMDPSERLIQISRRFYSGIERCYLAAITCLMTEAVNYKLPGDGGLFLLHCLGTKDLDGYDRHRTMTARALRFDPSCQLFVVLRRYLFALIEQYSLPETDRMFSDWLKDSIVPPNDLLQCGVLSLTREWRLLVELLAIISQDLRAKTNGRTSPLLPLSVAPVLGINNCPTVSFYHGGDLKIRNLKASKTFDDKTVTSSLLPAVNFIPNPNVLGTSHLLKMASNPVSPIISRVLPALHGCKDPACQARGSKDPPITQFMDDHSVCTVAFPDTDPLQKENQNTLHNLGLVDTCPTQVGEHSDNVMLRRFLQDSKVPVVDSLQSRDIPRNHFATFASRNLADADRNRMDLDSSEFAAPRRASDPMCKLPPVDRDSRSTEADVTKPDRPLFLQSDESEAAKRRTNSKLGDRLGVKLPAGTESISSEVDPGTVQSPDVRLTTTDFEQAAHLKAQCQHVAYIQRFFSPLLESVGLSAKGIRRTTLMKKFGGYFSADGLLQKFQIEIVSSVRNPGVPRGTTTTTAPGFCHSQHFTASYAGTNSRSTASANVGIRHCAFLCRNFSSRFTFRDIVDCGDNQSRVKVSPSAQVDIMPTTTNIDVLLNIDFLRQHINLPLLRLLHQFVTMVYCARDAHNSTELRHMDTVASDLGLSHKHGSRESSDLTDATVHSRSSGYVRFGGGSVESCGDRRNPLAHIDILSSADVPLAAETQCDLRSPERVSRSSAEKNSQKMDPLRQPLNQRHPTTSITKLSYPLTAGHFLCKTGGNLVSSTDTFTPDCWRRLLSYVELYTTVPKTRMILRKPPNSSSSGTTMPTITEEDRDYLAGPAGGSNRPHIKMNTVDNPPTTLDSAIFPGIAIVKPTILGRRLLTTVSYQPLNEDVESGPMNLQGTQGESTSDAHGEVLHPIGTCVTIPVEHTHNERPSPNLLRSHELGTLRKVGSVLPSPRSGTEPCFSPMLFDQFTRPWLCSERVPLAIFVTTKVHQMTMSAVLSEMNLVAGVRNAHGSFTHSTQLHIRGCFTERLSVQSTSLHCAEGQLRLTERLPPHIQEVVCVKSGRSHAMLSCRRGRQNERNVCLIGVGHISVALPHHPVRLHGVMQRQAKRISSTVSELLRGSPAARTHLNTWTVPDLNSSSTSRIVTTPTTGSTTTTASDVTAHLKAHKPTQQSNEAHTVLFSNSAEPVVGKPSHTALFFNVLAVSQGLTVNVALHPSLSAIYQINPVYFSGQLGPRGYVEINLTDHSLSLQSVHHPKNFPRSIKISLPRILTTVLRRESIGGRYSRGQRRQPMLTQGLTAEQGLYWHVQVKVDTLEQTLTTDMLNYIVVVGRLFMKEINEVIQKMAGDEQRACTSRPRPKLFPSTLTVTDPYAAAENGWLLSRAARGKTKFTLRIRLEEIQLMATTRSGAVKLEAKVIDVELTNRVCQASLDSCFLPCRESVCRHDPTKSVINVSKRPSNLGLSSVTCPVDHPGSFTFSGTGNPLFIYSSVAKICAELGYLDQDLFFDERTPEFRTVAFFKTTIALRSLLADEKFSSISATSHQQSTVAQPESIQGEHDAFLISLNRPTLWLKPFTFDRAILIWMVYKSEFAKWKEYMNYLASLSPASPMENIRQGATDHLFSPASTSLAKPHFRIDPHLATSCTAVPSTLNDSSFLPSSQAAPVLTDSNQRIIRLKPLPEGALLTKLFLQLNVEDLGVCLPITVAQPNPQSMGVDSRTALVLTLDRSRISACYRDSFVGQGEFTDFCLRFDDDFNVGSDDWKPDWRRASVDVQGKHHSLILNACVVPSGTFNVCSHDPDKRAQWNLLVQWQMRGLDFHLDDNIGRRLKSLISMLTRITGYDGAAPLLPTSAEEEEEGECVEESRVQRKLSGLAEADKVSDKEEPLGEQIRNANRTSISIVTAQQSDVTRESSQKHGGYSDIASLDRYRPGGCPPDSVANMLPFDLSQVRSMELHKHQHEIIEAQCCLAFKRQKWDTLRRKKGIAMRSPVFLRDPTKPPRTTTYSNFESQGLINDRIPRSSIVTGEPSHSRSQMVAFGRADPSSTSVSNSDVYGLNVHRASIVSKDESVYFDMESCEVAEQRVSDALENGCNNPSSCHLINDHCSNQDLWFDPQEAIGFDQIGFPFSDSNFPSMAEEQGEGEPTDYSSSDEAEEPNGVKREGRSHHPPPDKTRVLFGHLSSGIQDIGTQPKVLLQVNVQIHIDSGCCVLHPRLPLDILSTSVDLYSPINPNIVPAQYRFQTPNTIVSRPQTELGGRFSNSDLLGAYLERYKKHLLQDTPFLSTDLSVFLLPAVDIGLHYNSMTEVDFHTSPIPTGSSVPPTSPQFTSVTVSGASLLINQPTSVHSASLSLGSLRMDTHGTPSGKQAIDTTIPESKVSTINSHEFNEGYKPAMGNSGLKKQTDLFVSFFLQKLPKELIVHPALLDFLEQALESISLLADLEVESASISSDGEQAENKRNDASISHSAPLDTRFWETFPVHTVVHLHVQPLIVRFLCLPTSRMQCLMSLPFLDVIFSTNRSEVDDDAKSSPIQNEAYNRIPVFSGDNRDGSAVRQSRGPIPITVLADGATLHLPANSSTGDIVAEGGLCVTAILKEFRISIFHPYVDSKAMRSEPIWEATWSGDSLNLLVQDIQLNISRVVQTSLVLTSGDNPDSKTAESDLDHSNLHTHNHSNPALQTPAPEASFSGRSRNTLTNLIPPLSSWCLHRDVRFSGIFDIGVARFTCDTRRTLEILDIPNAWYRSSLARRLFIGNDEVLAEKCDESTEVVDETLQPEVFSSQNADTSPQKAEHPTAIDVDPRARPRYFSLATPSAAHWPPEILNFDKSYKPKRRSTVAKPRRSSNALDPTVHNFLNVKSSKEVTPASIPGHQNGAGGDTHVPANLPSLSTTLMMERGTAAAATPNSSMRVASWHALPIFCVHLKRFELNLFIGSAMGQTRLTMDELFFDGRVSLHSSGRKNTILSAGLGICQFVSEGGGVGGEICLLNADAKVCLDEDPTRDPLHSLDSRIGGFQLRIEYMNTNILLMRVSSLTLRLRDEWKLKDTARFIFERSQASAVLTSTRVARSSLTNAIATGECSPTAIEPQILESDVGAPPVYIRVVGEINWDQAQTAVVRTTTPDLIRSIRKVRDYFEEQVREGRMSLIGQAGSFGLLASRNPSAIRPIVSAHSGCTRSQDAIVGRTIIDKLLQRHWQNLLCESYNVYVREQLTVNPNFQPLSNPLSGMDDQLFPVLGGSLQLTGRSLGIACFAGSFRSAPDWAVFNIQYPTACFETEAQHEALDSSLVSSDPSDSDGWINVRQVLSFDLGSQPEFRPQMAYVLRVRRGNQPNTRNPPTLTIAEWMEFTFRGADNTVVNFVRTNDPESVLAVVQLAQFPIQFPDSTAGVATVIDDQTHTFGAIRETSASDTTSVSASSLGQPLKNPYVNTSKGEHPSSSMAASVSSTVRHSLHSVITAQPSALPRPHPLRPPVDGEILFILPSISLRITTDQRQTMAQPTLSSLSSVLPKHSVESTSSRSTTATSGARSWIYGCKTVPSSLSPGDSGNHVAHGLEPTVTLSPAEAVPGFAPTVKISFQTDFHGFVQLGLIDVPWLPSLINSYLNERLHDYELLTAVPSCSSQVPGLIDSGLVSNNGTVSDNLTTRLRELATTSSPMVQDARIYEIVHWSLSPMCRWLLASNIGVPAFDRLLENIGFRKARVTIPKWLQRGVMDNLDSVMATLIHASMQLTIKRHSQRSAHDHENPGPVVETASGQFRARSESTWIHGHGSQ